ncbi:MAG: amidohydrolase family protein [Armatimonadetes bacterium]|nr:amidohydrolase family protein [Armatimonadota bacterium]
MSTLIKCGMLIDGTGARPVQGGAILVDGTSIAMAGPADRVTAPAGVVVCDLSAYTVMPGMIDCHDHLQFDAGDEEAMSREPLAWLTARAAKNARQILRAGITTVRDVGAKGFGDVEIKKAIEAGLIPGPRLLVSGHFVVRTGGHAWYLGEQADGPDAIRAAIRRQIRGGADLVKFMITGGIATKGMDPVGATYTREEIWAAVDEAHREGKKAAAHGYGGPAVMHAVEAGLDSLEHGAMCSEAELEAMASKGTSLVCTCGVMEHVVATPGIPEFFREKGKLVLARYIDTLSKARRIGVKVAVGGDTYHADPGVEMAALVKAGFTPMEAVQAVTRNGADLCGVLDQAGTIEAGKRADIIAVEGNPLDDVRAVRNVRWVMQDGVVRRRLDGGLEDPGPLSRL